MESECDRTARSKTSASSASSSAHKSRCLFAQTHLKEMCNLTHLNWSQVLLLLNIFLWLKTEGFDEIRDQKKSNQAVTYFLNKLTVRAGNQDWDVKLILVHTAQTARTSKTKHAHILIIKFPYFNCSITCAVSLLIGSMSNWQLLRPLHWVNVAFQVPVQDTIYS